MADKKIVLGLIGELAAGKTTIVYYLKERYGAASFRFSDPLRNTLDLYDLEISRDNMQNLSTVLRKQFGENLLAKAMAKQAKDSNKNLIVIDGVRRFTDIENLTKLPEFHLVYITADVKTRYERYISRDENAGDKNLTFEDFQAKEGAEADKQVPEVAKSAEFKIDNNGDFEKLNQQIEDILSKVSSE